MEKELQSDYKKNNYEYWEDEIIEVLLQSNVLALVNGEPVYCKETFCDNCDFYNACEKTCESPTRLKFWLNQDHVDICGNLEEME